METLTVNLYGGPGSGKSTIMAGLFYRLKMDGWIVELAPEWCKQAVYEERPYAFRDQIYNFAQQWKTLNALQGKVEIAVCDSPLLLHCVYAEGAVQPELLEPLRGLVRAAYGSCWNLDAFLERPETYERSGRIHTRNESLAIDSAIKSEMKKVMASWSSAPADSSACESLFELVRRTRAGRPRG